MNPISPQAADAVEAAQQFTVNRPEACLIPISVQFPQRTANTAAIQSLHSVSSNTSPALNLMNRTVYTIAAVKVLWIKVSIKNMSHIFISSVQQFMSASHNDLSKLAGSVP